MMILVQYIEYMGPFIILASMDGISLRYYNFENVAIEGELETAVFKVGGIRDPIFLLVKIWSLEKIIF